MPNHRAAPAPPSHRGCPHIARKRISAVAENIPNSRGARNKAAAPVMLAGMRFGRMRPGSSSRPLPSPRTFPATRRAVYPRSYDLCNPNRLSVAPIIAENSLPPRPPNRGCEYSIVISGMRLRPPAKNAASLFAFPPGGGGGGGVWQQEFEATWRSSNRESAFYVPVRHLWLAFRRTPQTRQRDPPESTPFSPCKNPPALFGTM